MADSNISCLMDDSYGQSLEIWRLILVINVNFQGEPSLYFFKVLFFVFVFRIF